ncbi:gliding motility-associated ABC transporter substrate-binding protein GldG [Fulvivirga ulvae]|uniref:gliding motility-associated ABC transporter substrate-binding protein GldG n=1 Tax=Fulvivirga ulvae TaxID=2904245 RepID=UPI001F27B15A|nr:gliding motility-associated ABC transporter substrate-binding protein GldG [Fulvivirga ulvae]UII32533.1 gliding motility-associated ABC transporter substrate-binding protein GldG [Fulvivirga ulvae]
MVKGHRELDSLEIASFASALANLYDLEIENLQTTPSDYDALIIAKPTRAFSEQEKYHLDQYVMGGGKVLMLIDKLQADMDSASAVFNYAFPYDLNIDDQLFKYGIRVNSDLLMDNSAAGYPVVVGNMGDQPQIKLQNWPFYPIINRFSDHAITRNMGAVLLRFGSSIDTIRTPGIKKTPLMFSSQYSRVVSAPVNVSVQDLRTNMTSDKFDKQYLPVAYLLEGKFESLYKNRFKPENIDDSNFIESAKTGAKLLVVSDGDIARNEINTRNNSPQPLGFYPFSQNTFANQDFLMNAIAYLIDDEGIITARNKEIKIRPLNKVKISKEKTKWQIINMAIPVLLLIVYGVVRFYWRKKKYTGFGTE